MSKVSQPSAGNSSSSTSFSVGDVGFQDVWEISRRHWLLLASALFVGWGLSVAYFLIAPPNYESTAQVLVMRKDPKLATTGAQSAREDEAKVSEDLLATHMQIVQSKRIVSTSLQRDGLDQLPSILEKLGKDETPTDYVIDKLLVSRGGTGQAKTAHVLNIAFRHSSDQECQEIVNAIMRTYQEFLAEKFQDVNKEAAELIVKAQTDLGGELEKSEAAYQAFREKVPLLFNGDRVTNIHRVRYDQIQQELSNLQIQSTEAKSRLELVEAALQEMEQSGGTDLERLALIDEKNAQRVGILVTVDRGQADTAEFQSRQPERMAGATAEFSALLTLMAKEKTLLEDYGAEHPEVKNTRQQIALMQNFLTKKADGIGFVEKETMLNAKDLVNAYVMLLRHDVQSLGRRELELASLAAKEEVEAKTLVSFELDGETLRKDVTRQQELYDAVVDRLRDINLAKDYGGFITEMIAAAELGEKVSPKLLICLALGTFAGLVLGGGGVALAEFRDRSFHTPEEIGAALELAILSHMPELRMLKDSQLAAAIAATGSTLEPTLLAVADPCIVAPRVDGVVLVVRVSKDSRPQAVRAKEMLDSIGANVIGTIVNASEAGAQFGSKRYGYGDQYGYGYGYGKGTVGDYYTTDEQPKTKRSMTLSK